MPTPGLTESLLPYSRIKNEDPSRYIADQDLKDAIRVSIILRKPLLVTGEPGTGKTQLASYFAWWLNQETPENPVHGPLMFEAKSTSAARDLFYTYDTLGRFQAVQLQVGSQSATDYITYNALGLAILNANPKDQISHWLPSSFKHQGPSQSVVLIDEVDKAPRDFPNDILNEVDNMYFTIREFGNPVISAPANLHPYLILTSNSEKNLPAAFLRRCIYYHIPPPTSDRLMEIVCARMTELAAHREPFLSEALDFFDKLRAPSSGIKKMPATAELLDWLLLVRTIGPDFNKSLRDQPRLLEQCLRTLIKKEEDLEIAKHILKNWTRVQ